MRYEERNGLRILIADFGCLIHNIKTDMYAEKFYLGIHATLDNFEEVEDENIDKKLIIKMKELDKKSKTQDEKLKNKFDELDKKEVEREKKEKERDKKEEEREKKEKERNEKAKEKLKELDDKGKAHDEKINKLDNGEREIDKELKARIDSFEKKEKLLNKIGKIVASQVTDDDVAVSIKEFYDEWEKDIEYKLNQYVLYSNVLYKVLSDHTSQADWKPIDTPSLYAKLLTDPTGEEILDWVRPDSTNAYMKGDKVNYNGKTYTSLIDHNVWSPDEYPTGWGEINGGMDVDGGKGGAVTNKPKPKPKK
jgi:hypothetical protein